MSKTQIKLAKTLKRKKHRKEENLFVIEGVKMLQEAKRAEEMLGEHLIEHLMCSVDMAELNLPDATRISERDMAAISSLTTPPGILAICRMRGMQPLITPDIIYVDELRDPGNLGTLMRLADWFGETSIALSEGSVDPYNPKVVQSTMGAIFRVPFAWVTPDFLDDKQNEGYTIAAAHLKGTSIATAMDLDKKTVLIVGNESHGVSPSLLEKVDRKIMIPGNGQAESLNVTLATSIILSQMKFSKQKIDD